MFQINPFEAEIIGKLLLSAFLGVQRETLKDGAQKELLLTSKEEKRNQRQRCGTGICQNNLPDRWRRKKTGPPLLQF